jgi:hypothetical protein
VKKKLLILLLLLPSISCFASGSIWLDLKDSDGRTIISFYQTIYRTDYSGACATYDMNLEEHITPKDTSFYLGIAFANVFPHTMPEKGRLLLKLRNGQNLCLYLSNRPALHAYMYIDDDGDIYNLDPFGYKIQMVSGLYPISKDQLAEIGYGVTKIRMELKEENVEAELDPKVFADACKACLEDIYNHLHPKKHEPQDMKTFESNF